MGPVQSSACSLERTCVIVENLCHCRHIALCSVFLIASFNLSIFSHVDSADMARTFLVAKGDDLRRPDHPHLLAQALNPTSERSKPIEQLGKTAFR